MTESLDQLRLVVYPIICKVLYIPGGAGFLPSTVEPRNPCYAFTFLYTYREDLFQNVSNNVRLFNEVKSNLKQILYNIWKNMIEKFIHTILQ